MESLCRVEFLTAAAEFQLARVFNRSDLPRITALEQPCLRAGAAASGQLGIAALCGTTPGNHMEPRHLRYLTAVERLGEQFFFVPTWATPTGAVVRSNLLKLSLPRRALSR